MRTTPDVSLVADPATGAWIADPYNLDPSNPFEVVGGTSLSAPAWAGLLALVNQGRAAAGESALNSASPTEAQQALYMLPQSDYNVIASGSNGYTAAAGYNLVTGLGTPVANLLVPDLVAYQGPGTVLQRADRRPIAGRQFERRLDRQRRADRCLQRVRFVHRDGECLEAKDLDHKPTRICRGDMATAPGVPIGYSPTHRTALAVQSPRRRAYVRRRPLRAPSTAMDDAIDQALGVVWKGVSGDTLIGDLAFEQIYSGAHKTNRSESHR